MEKPGSFWFNVREDTNPRYRFRVGGFFNGDAADTFTGTRVIPSNTLTWGVATYDGAHLKTHVADGDGTQLALDRRRRADRHPEHGRDHHRHRGEPGGRRQAPQETRPGGSGTNEHAEAFFNGTMSRFLVYDTALTQGEIASVISGPTPSGTPGAVQAHLVQKSAMSTGANPTMPYRISRTQGTCPAGSTYHVAATAAGSPTVPHAGTALSATLGLSVGPTYAIAVDCGGDRSTTNVRSTGFQEGAPTYTKTWHSTSFAGAWGGTARYATAASASATFPARVYVDGALKATVNTRSSSKLNRVLPPTSEWAGDGAHPLRIVNLAARGHPRRTVDGLLTRS